MDLQSKIYIAGHSGMVGSALIRALQKRGYKNLVTRNFQELDLTDQTETSRFFERERPAYVFLAAAKVGGIIANTTYRAQFIYENLQIQNNIIHHSWKNGVKKLLFLGSSCIYPRLAPQPIKEDSLLTGELEYTNEPYAIAKIAGIKMCESYNLQYGANFISVMPTNLYGPNDNYDLEKSHVLPAMIRKMYLASKLEQGDLQAIRKDLNRRPVEGINGESGIEEITRILEKYGIIQSIQPEERENSVIKLVLWGTGSPYREFMHVDDLAEACVFLMENRDFHDMVPKDGPILNSHINIGTGIDQSIRELAQMVKKVVGFKGEILWDSTKPDGTPRKLLDVSKLNSLGFKAGISLNDGINRTYREYVNSQ